MRKNKKQIPKEETFRHQVAMLPTVVAQRFLGQLLAGGAVAALTVAMLLYFKQWQYCVGFLFALYIVYMAMSLVWDYHKGKIECKKMVCIKAQHIIRKNRVFVIMREFGQETATQDNTMQFYIPTSKKNAALITPQTIMNIYYNPNNPLEITAWEIIGNQGST